MQAIEFVRPARIFGLQRVNGFRQRALLLRSVFRESQRDMPLMREQTFRKNAVVIQTPFDIGYHPAKRFIIVQLASRKAQQRIAARAVVAFRENDVEGNKLDMVVVE